MTHGRMRIKLVAYYLGFFGLSLLTAVGVTRLSVRFGVFLSPKWLVTAAIVSLMTASAFFYLRSFQGFTLKRLAAKPNISLTRNVIGLKPTSEAYVCRTREGLRATYQAALPLRERTDLQRETHRLLRVVFGSSVVSAVVFTDPVPSLQYRIDPEVEPQARALFEFENQRQSARASRGVTRFQICVAVESLEEAASFPMEHRGIKPIPFESFAKGFFPPGLFQQPGAIALQKGRGVPATVENGAGTFLPLVVTAYGPNYQSRANHDRFQGLAKHLRRDLMAHFLVFPVSRGELRRFQRIDGLERGFPFKSLLDPEEREALGLRKERIETLKRERKSATPPKILKQIWWVALKEGDHPRVIAKKAAGFLLEQGLSIEGVTPTRALRYMAGLHPGLEFFAAGPGQGLGIAGTQEEVSKELELLGQWPGTPGGQVMFEDEGGHGIFLDLFAGGNNFNGVIVGEPGSGKSFLINGMVCGHLARSRFNRALLVDYGGSNDGVVAALNGHLIAFKSTGARISPIPLFEEPLDRKTFQSAHPEEHYEAYLGRLRVDRKALYLEALQFITKVLCRRPVASHGVFLEAYLHAMETFAKPGVPLHTILERVVTQAGRDEKEATETIQREAFGDLKNLFLELASVVRCSSFIGETNVDVTGHRLISFNLDGFNEADKHTLLGLINLLIQQMWAQPRAGKTIIVFDEAHKFLKLEDGGPAPLGHLLEATQRVTRKYGVSLLLASQSPDDFKAFPSLVRQANHHLVMRLKDPLSADWLIKDPHLMAQAKAAEPAGAAGFATVLLGTATPDGDLQLRCKYRCSPVAVYTFTSRHEEKNLLRLGLHLTGLDDLVALALGIHREDPEALMVPIGSPLFFERLQPLIQTCYQPVKDHLDQLFADLEICPFLELFLNGEPARFETVARHAKAMDAFLEGSSDV